MTIKMNRKVKAKWVKALLSGDYKQTKQRLRSNTNRFCCLGVLCNIHAQEHPEIAADQKRKTAYMGEIGFPAKKVWRWAGLTNNNPAVIINGRLRTLAGHNDKGESFEDIAKAIKEQL